METIKEILSTVLSSNLLGGSLGEVAKAINYEGRATLYRIVNGTASERAVTGICQRLKDKLFISEDSLKRIRTTIANTEILSRLLKPLFILKDPSSAQVVVDAFLSKDYSIFPEDFKRGNLPEILSLEHDDPDSFYNMLAYFYYKYSGVDYYAKGETHKQRCSRVLESLGQRLIEKFPENDLAIAQIYNYSKSEIFNSEAPILWSLIQRLSCVLQSYGRPIDLLNEINTRRLPEDREYWETGNKDDVVLTYANPTLFPNNYSYDIFRIDMNTDKVEYLGSIVFLSEEILSFYSALQKVTKMGVYGFEDNELYIGWEKPNDNPTTVGNKWILLDKKCSQRLRHLDKSIDDERLFSVKLKQEGFRKKSGYEVADVLVSRESLTIKLTSGCLLTVAISAAPFLNKIKPNFSVGVFERVSDNRCFVWWPQIRHCLPLEFFSECNG